MSTIHAHCFPTEFGRIVAAVDGAGRLVLLAFLAPDDDEEEVERLLCRAAGVGAGVRRDESACAELQRSVERFLSGSAADLELPLAPRGTPFQMEVWRELRRIPYGSTISYAELARRIGRPRAVRAVARANATNPISIAIPCHRVIGSDGSLTGYGGGIDVKRALLLLESRRARAVLK